MPKKEKIFKIQFNFYSTYDYLCDLSSYLESKKDYIKKIRYGALKVDPNRFPIKKDAKCDLFVEFLCIDKNTQDIMYEHLEKYYIHKFYRIMKDIYRGDPDYAI